ncbi:uncharacterized protein LOC144647269 isoform X2 [Oculina patagonica]
MTSAAVDEQKMSHESHDVKVRTSVSPHFCSGLLSLESFAQIVDETPHDISVAAARRMMPNLLGLVNEAHEAFQTAESRIQEINDKLDNELEDIVVQEKTTDDRLRQTQEDLAKLKERGKVLQDESNGLKRQLANDEADHGRERKYFKEKRAKLEEKRKKRGPKTVLYTLGGALLGGPVGAAAASIITAVALQKDIDNAEKADDEAWTQLMRTKDRIRDKGTELSNLSNEKKKLRKNHTTKSKEIKMLKLRKTEIKHSQARLARLNVSIKSCTMLVGTTTTRANMMAVEANGGLPDIEAMISPLKAIADDLSDASLSNSRLLSGNVDMKGIGCKIQMITSKALKTITQGDIDEWA